MADGMSGGAAGGGAVDVLWIDVRAQTNENSFREMEAQAGASGERAGEATGGGLKSKMGAALAGLPAIALAAGAAVGAALVAGLTSAVNIAQQVNQGQKDIQASLGVTAQEAVKLGEVAKKVFGNNWGEDLKGAQQAVINVRREIKGLTDDDLKSVTEGSLAIAERFEEDQSKVAAAVQSLMKSTGQSAEQALDFISAGFQKGLNSSGDFLDTLNEYAPQFEKAKITGDALFSLLETGAAKGALGTDKVADSFKEFGLTLIDVSDDSKAVYRELGLDQEKLAAQVNSGAITQAQAYQLVTEKLRGIKGTADQTRIAAAIFGGAGEDFGPGLTQLDLTKTKLTDIKGSTDDVKNASNTLSAVFVTAGRQLQLALEPAGQELLKLANEAMPYVSAAIEKLSPIVVDVVRRLVEGFRQARESVAPVLPVVQKLGDLFQSVFGLIRDLWLNVLQPVFVAIAPAVEIAFGAVGNIISTTLSVITGVINAVSALLRGDFAAAWASIGGIVTDALDGVKKHVTEFLPKMQQFGVDLGKQILTGLQNGLDGLQAMILAALARALTGLGDKLPAILQPIAEKLAQAAQDAADGNAAQVRTRRPNGPVFGPRQDSTPADPNQPIIVTGKDLVTLLGLAGRTVLNEFGVSGKDYKHDGNIRADAVHNGIDFAAPRGTPILAPFTGQVTFRRDGGNGNVFDLTDAEGKRLTGIHLDSFNKEIQNALASGAKSVFVQAGSSLGTVGNTGDTAGSFPHLHLMAYLPNGDIVDAKTVKFVSLPDLAGDQRVFATPKVGTPGNAGTGGNPPPPTTIPLPTVAEQEKYTFSLADWNKYSREALAIAQQLKEANVSTDNGFILRVRARAEAFKEEGDQQSGALAFAQEVLARTKKQAEAEKETDLQRDQRTRREQLAQEQLEASIRKAGTARLDQIIKIGVTSTNSLEKINLAEGELERRGKLSADAARAAGVAREKAAKDASAALKENAVLSGRIAAETAREAQALAKKLADDQRRIDEARMERIGAESDALIKAANGRYSNGQASTDAAFRSSFGAGDVGLIRSLADATGLTVAQIRADVNAALADAQRFAPETARVIERVYAEALAHRKEVTAEQGRLTEQAAKDEEDRIQRVLAAYVAQAQERGRLLTESAAEEARIDAGLNASYAQQSQDRLALIKERFTAEEDAKTAAFEAEQAENARIDAAINDSLAQASQGRIDLIRNAELAAEDAGVTVGFLTGLIDNLIAQGLDPRKTGLTTWLDDLAKGSGAAAAAAQTVKDNIDDLIARAQIAQQIIAPLTGTSDPRRTLTPITQTPVSARGRTLTDEQLAFQKSIERKGDVDAYTDSVRGLTVAQLEGAQALALANGEQEKYFILTDLLAQKIAILKDQELNVTLKVLGLDTGIKALDLYKSAVSGVGNVITSVFTDLVAGTASGVDSILKNMALMALGIVKSVAQAIIAYQAQAIAMALIKSAGFDFVGAALALAAAAAVAGIVAGLESKIRDSSARPTTAVSRGVTSGPIGQAAAQNASVSIPTSQVTLLAAPEWVSVMGAHVDRFGAAVDRFGSQGVRVASTVRVESQGGLGAFALTTP